MRTNANNNNYGAKMNNKKNGLKNFSALIWAGSMLYVRVCFCFVALLFVQSSCNYYNLMQITHSVLIRSRNASH